MEICKNEILKEVDNAAIKLLKSEKYKFIYDHLRKEAIDVVKKESEAMVGDHLTDMINDNMHTEQMSATQTSATSCISFDEAREAVDAYYQRIGVIEEICKEESGNGI